MQGYKNLLSQPDPQAAATNAILAGQDVPPLTIYFNKEMKGVTRRTLSVRFAMPLPTKGASGISAGAYLPIDLRMYGDILEVTGAIPTPHTGETAPYAVSFLPRLEFFFTPDGTTLAWPTLGPSHDRRRRGCATGGTLDLPQVIAALKGDFVVARHAEHRYERARRRQHRRQGRRRHLHASRPDHRRQEPVGQPGQRAGCSKAGSSSTGQARSGSGRKDRTARHEELLSAFGLAMFGHEGRAADGELQLRRPDRRSTGVPAALAERIVAGARRQAVHQRRGPETRLNISKRNWKRLRIQARDAVTETDHGHVSTVSDRLIAALQRPDCDHAARSAPARRPVPVCGGLECLCRPRFFPGQLLTEDDLNRLEQYVIAKNKLHNRYFHGSGVVCGLEVVCDPCSRGERRRSNPATRCRRAARISSCARTHR